jgi:hypothetical protein
MNLCAHEGGLMFNGSYSAYYSYSLNDPPQQHRPFTTQPVMNQTIAVDLATLGAAWSDERTRFTFALQAGTWADVNYVGRDSSWKYVREATAELNIDSTWWFKVGIGPSHIGHESAINAANMLLSRSLIADFTPYYLTGAGIGYRPTEAWTFNVFVVNGWQKIIDNNNELSLGTSVVWKPSGSSTMSWNTYVGNDAPTGTGQRLRVHSDLWWDHTLADSLRIVATVDLGMLERTDRSGSDIAGYAGVKCAWRFTHLFRIGGRVEAMNDPNNVLVPATDRFETISASIGLDIFPTDHFIVRLESRGMHSTKNVHPSSVGLLVDDLYFTLGIAGQF